MRAHPFFFLLLFASSASAASSGDSRGEALVEATFQAIEEAVAQRDTRALERLVDEQFVMIHAYGPSEPRSTWLAFVRQGRLARQIAERSENDVRIRIAGDTAIRSAIVRLRRRDRNQDTWIKGTITFAREAGAWRAVQQQSSLLHEGPLVDVAGLSAFAGPCSIPGHEGFVIQDAGVYLTLAWENGAEMPLIPLGGDRFVSGYGSTMIFHRAADGTLAGAVRLGTAGRELFRASCSR